MFFPRTWAFIYRKLTEKSKQNYSGHIPQKTCSIKITWFSRGKKIPLKNPDRIHIISRNLHLLEILLGNNEQNSIFSEFGRFFVAVVVPQLLGRCHDHPQHDADEEDQENPAHVQKPQLVDGTAAPGILFLRKRRKSNWEHLIAN